MKLALLDKQYDSEELADLERDVYESLTHELIKQDCYGFSKGIYKVTVEYEEE